MMESELERLSTQVDQTIQKMHDVCEAHRLLQHRIDGDLKHDEPAPDSYLDRMLRASRAAMEEQLLFACKDALSCMMDAVREQRRASDA